MDIINKYGYDDPQLMAILEGRRLPGRPPQAHAGNVPDQILDLMMGQTEGRTAPIQKVQSVPYVQGPSGMIPSGDLWKTPQFRSAVDYFINTYGHEPATDSDFAEVESMMHSGKPSGNIEQMVLDQMLGGYPSAPSGPATTGKPSGLTASGLARLESQRKVSGPSGPPPRRGPRV